VDIDAGVLFVVLLVVGKAGEVEFFLHEEGVNAPAADEAVDGCVEGTREVEADGVAEFHVEADGEDDKAGHERSVGEMKEAGDVDEGDQSGHDCVDGGGHGLEQIQARLVEKLIAILLGKIF